MTDQQDAMLDMGVALIRADRAEETLAFHTYIRAKDRTRDTIDKTIALAQEFGLDEATIIRRLGLTRLEADRAFGDGG